MSQGDRAEMILASGHALYHSGYKKKEIPGSKILCYPNSFIRPLWNMQKMFM